MSLELEPKWCGYLLVDADSVKVGNPRESALLGVDVKTLDIPHLALAEHEDLDNWLAYFHLLKHTLAYPFEGIASDGDPAIERVIELISPGTPHQLCGKHFHDGLHRYLRYQSSHGGGTCREVQRFEHAAQRCLYGKSLEEAKRLLTATKIDPGSHKIHLDNGIQILERDFQRLTQHFLYPGLPRTTNVAEGMIRKQDRRLDAMDSFASHKTAWNTLKMLTLHTRFRILTDCRYPHKHKNAFSTLQLAGVNTDDINRIEFSQKSSRPTRMTKTSTTQL